MIRATFAGLALLLITSCDLFTPSFAKNLDNPVDPTAPSYVAQAPTGVTASASDGSVVGQTSLRKTGLPSLPVPRGSVVRSVSTRPASAKVTTSNGEARKLALTFGWMRPSKLRLPEMTEERQSLWSSWAFSIAGWRGPNCRCT